jgi:uncharacterized protein
MRKVKDILAIYFLLCIMISSCVHKSTNEEQRSNDTTGMGKKYNPVIYFEIPVNDIERSMKFYTSVFNFTFEKEVIDKNEMALFPFEDENAGISGSLAKGEIYKPTKDGVLIYFKTESIDSTLKLAVQNGGKILYPKTSNGDLGFVAEFEDTEGNRIALHQSIK